MWRKIKKDLSVSDASHSEAESHSPSNNSHSPRAHSHSLARALLRPFTRKSHHEHSPRRTRSDTQLLGEKLGRELRLSRSSVEETRVPEKRAAETRVPGTRVAETRAAETRVAETRVAETKVAETRAAGTRAAETRAAGTRAAETRVPGTRVTETTAAKNMELAPKVEVREVQKVAAIPPATSEIREVGKSPVAGLNAPKGDVVIAPVAGVSTASSLPTLGAPEGMSEQMISELTSAFKYFDHNSDGSIDKKELGAVLRSLGDSPTDGELEAMIAAVDQNGDGCICLSEFLDLNKRALEAGLGGDKDKELRATFDVFDLDGNGLISCEELQQVLSNLLGEPVVKADCFRMIQGVDKDGDGQVNFQEFHTMMQQPMPC